MARQTPDLGGGGEPRAARGIRGASEGGGGGFVQQGNEESLAVVAFGFAHDALQLGTVGGVILRSMYNLSFSAQ